MDFGTIGTVALWILAVALVGVGLAGLALPALPGAPLLFAGLLVAAWAEDFQYLGTGGIVTLAILSLLTYPIDIIAGALGAKRFGASKRAIGGAAPGAFIGGFFGIPGSLLGPFAGALLGELSQQWHLGKAGMSGVGATLGFLVGAVAKLTVAFAMIGLFLVLRFN